MILVSFHPQLRDVLVRLSHIFEGDFEVYLIYLVQKCNSTVVSTSDYFSLMFKICISFNYKRFLLVIYMFSD